MATKIIKPHSERNSGSISGTIQRAYIDVSDGSRIPTKGIKLGSKVTELKDVGEDKDLHIFAHSAGDNLSEVKSVHGKDPNAFASWLVKAGRAFDKNDFDMSKPRSYQIWIHACASADFARRVKERLEAINEMNSSITVWGTEGISATSTEGEAVVIPMDFSNEWLKFEEKLAKTKARAPELKSWKKKYVVCPAGYKKY